MMIFAACTATRIGEVSGVRAEDIDRETWMWTVRRQTTPSPGGLIDKGTKGKRARTDLRHTGLTRDGRRRRTGARPTEDRRTRITDHNPALPTPRPAVDRRRRDSPQRPLEGPPVPRRSPATRRLDQ